MNLKLEMYYLTNKSFSVEQNDESHVSFESSSSPLPNQKLDEDGDADDVDAFDVDAFLCRESFDRVDLRRNPSMAFPIKCGSTILWLSQRNLLFGFFGSLARSSLSLKRSSTSFENDTVTLAVFRSDFFRAIGWWRFSNQPDNAAAFLSAADVPLATICLALCRIETSKLFDRFDRVMPAAESGVSELPTPDDVDGRHLAGEASSTLLISVADDARDEMIDMRSVFVTTMPVFLKKPGDFELDGVADAAAAAAADAADVPGITNSEARRLLAGIGVNAEPTKSE